MIILVAVTLNIALGENGLIAKAKETRTKQEEQTIYEDIQGMMELNNNGEIEVDKTVDNVKAKYPGTELSGTTLIVPGKYGTYKYKITQSTIEYIEKEKDIELSKLEKYILGADGNGRILFGENGIMDRENLTFKQDPSNANSKIHEYVKLAYMEEDTMDMHIRYGRDVYKFTVDSSYNTVEKSLTKISTPEGNLGKYVTYQGKNWIVLYDDEEKVELISAEALGELALGYEDAGAKTNVTVADENSLTSEERFKRGAWSYNNVITTLTKACKDETGITEGIRNVGGPAEDTTTAKVILEEVKSGENGFKPNEDLDETTLTNLKTNIESLKKGDENYLKDYNQMKALGILATDIPKDYLLASRFVDVYSSSVDFRERFIGDAGYLDDIYLCSEDSYGYAHGNSHLFAVRPVVYLSSGILDGKTGEGTRQNPINLD